MQNDARLARGLDARAEGYAIQASRLPKAERTPEVLAEIEQQLLKLEDGGLALSSECLKRQDAEIEASRGNH